MQKIIYKWFWLWNFDKEEKWLNEMAAKGFALTGVGLCRFEFEDCAPGENNIRMEMLKNSITHPESHKYIRFLEETGVEHVGTIYRWVYFRKKSGKAPFDLFSDIDSRIRHLNRTLTIPGVLGVVNMLNAINMTHGLVNNKDYYLFPAIVSWAASLLMIYGFIRIYLKKLQLKKERLLHE